MLHPDYISLMMLPDHISPMLYLPDHIDDFPRFPMIRKKYVINAQLQRFSFGSENYSEYMKFQSLLTPQLSEYQNSRLVELQRCSKKASNYYKTEMVSVFCRDVLRKIIIQGPGRFHDLFHHFGLGSLDDPFHVILSRFKDFEERDGLYIFIRLLMRVRNYDETPFVEHEPRRINIDAILADIDVNRDKWRMYDRLRSLLFRFLYGPGKSICIRAGWVE